VILPFSKSLMKIRPLCAAALIVLAAAFAASPLRADLVWTPETGWILQGGALSGLVGPEGRNALDLMNKARAKEESHHYLGAIHAYSQVTKKYGNSIFASEAYYRIAKLRLLRHQYYKAFDAYQNIVARFPNEKRFTEIIDQQFRIAEALLNGARNHAFGWLPGFPNRERGVQDLEQVVANAPYSDYAPLALMMIARGEQYLGDKDSAIDALDQLTNTYQQSVLAPDAYLRIAQLRASLVAGPLYDQAQTKDSITYFEDFMILFPGDAKIASAADGLDKMKVMLAESKMKIGDFYFYKRDNYTAARVYYNEAITSYPDSAVAEQAKKRLAAVDAKASGETGPEPKKKHFLFFF
jgi:outer membrane protein assembly factor BamD